MRRDGLLTGYLWNKNGKEKVKVKAKPTNASKASGRCGLSKCSMCHQQPVSKAKSKTKGRNKRALSKLPVDDEWAFCKRATAGHAKTVSSLLSLVDHDVSCAYDGPVDACCSDADLFGHGVDDDGYIAYDVCPDVPNPPCHEVNYNALAVHDAKEINAAGDVSDAGIHTHDDVIKDAGMLACAAASHHGGYKMHSYHVFGPDGKLYTSALAVPIICAENLEKVASDVNTGICVKEANDGVIIDDDEDDNVNGEFHSTMPNAKNGFTEDDKDVANDRDANEESRVIIVHAADDVSNDDNDDDDDSLYNDEDAYGFQSLISGLMDVKWPTHHDSNEVLEDESEENSLSSDWCYVADSVDAIDDWYLC